MTATHINPKLPSMIRDLYRADLRERSIQNMLDLAADLVQELIDLRAEQGACAPQPTEGEREALADALGANQSDRAEGAPVFAGTVLHPRQAYAIADAVLAAGFRRGAPAEPAEEGEWEYAWRVRDDSLEYGEHIWPYGDHDEWAGATLEECQEVTRESWWPSEDRSDKELQRRRKASPAGPWEPVDAPTGPSLTPFDPPLTEEETDV